MRFAMLCYGDESRTWTKEDDDRVMAQHYASNARLTAEGRLGPSLRLRRPDTARTVRSGGAGVSVTDGPFAETKEVLLGFWVFDAEDMEAAVEIAREFASHQQAGILEVRPVMEYVPGAPLP